MNATSITCTAEKTGGFHTDACIESGGAVHKIRKTRAGGEKRGNCRDRAARRAWMLRTWGDGIKCPCVHCGAMLSDSTVEADRIVPGGSYRRDNVQPACRSCNLSRSNNTEWKY